jgi:uncharacterized NAD-dependent epimerase/dehydratase family protein
MKSRRLKRAILEKDRENTISNQGKHLAKDKLSEICIADGVRQDYQGYGQQSAEQKTNDLDEDVLDRMDFIACLLEFAKLNNGL